MADANTLRAAELIDLDRYPIDELDCNAGAALLQRCQQDLARAALCALPDFIRPDALRRMVEEATALVPLAHYRNEKSAIYYASEDNTPFPPEHPRNARVQSRYRQVLNHHIANDSLLRKLYLWTPLTEFVARVYQAESMYRSQCPHLSLTCKIAGRHDTDGWHYDPNDGVVSLLLQKPERGGEFEYAPYIRSEDDERYDDVAKLFANPTSHGVRPAMEPGTFVFFNGKLSMHRVTPVGKTRQPRIIALLSYDRRPDQVFGQSYIDHLRTFPTDIGIRAQSAEMQQRSAGR